MSTTEGVFDQRKHHRFALNDGASVAFGRDSGELGEIIDISIGGLAYCYFGKKAQSKESSRLDVLLSNGRSGVGDLPFTTVSDVKMYHDLPVGSLTRRCSIAFGELTKNQRTALVRLIENHTTLAEQLSERSHIRKAN